MRPKPSDRAQQPLLPFIFGARWPGQDVSSHTCPWEEACQTFPHTSSRSKLTQRVPAGHSPRRGQRVAPPLTQASFAWTTSRRGFQYFYLLQISAWAREGKHCIKTCPVLNSSPLQPRTPQTSSPAGTTSSQSIFLVRDPKAANQGPRTYQSPKLSKTQIVQILFKLEDTLRVVILKIILSTYVQGQTRPARSETRPLSTRQG